MFKLYPDVTLLKQNDYIAFKYFDNFYSVYNKSISEDIL